MAEIATGNPDDALDILQDAMYKLVQKYSNKSPEEWGPLFQTILQSRINDWYRRNSVRNRFRSWLGGRTEDEEVDPLQTLEDPGAYTPEDKLKLERSMSDLERAIGALPLRQQQALMLRLWEGMDVKQTAQAMSCAEGSVKTHYSRAIHTLRDKLGDHWP